MSVRDSMVEFALLYAGIGWHVFPCYPMRDGICGCGRPQCESPGKHPVWIEGVVENGLREASTDPNVIRAMWARVPDASIGVVMEPSGLCALDLDDYKEESDLVKLAVLEQTLGPLPATVTQRSGSGRGYHTVFRAPGFPVRGVIGGIVVRAKAYIIVAPSNHASGDCYTWQAGLAPGQVEVAEFPEAWKRALEKSAEVGTIGAPTDEPEWLRSIPAEQRLADARAHIERETGEIKGQSKAGTTFDVIRSVVRRYAIRDPEVALALAEEYDKKCVPPWGARIGRHVWSAYNKATEPPWGYAYRGVAERMALPPVPDEMVLATLKSLRTKRPSDPQKIMEKELVTKLLDGEYLGESERIATETLVKVCPPGTTDSQIIQVLLNTHMSDQRAEELVREVRLAQAARVPRLDELIPDVVVAGHNFGRPVQESLDFADDPQAPMTPDQELLSRLRQDEDGTPFPTPYNLYTIFNGDSVLKGNVRFNMVTKKVEIEVLPFKGTDPNTLGTYIRVYLDSKWHLNANESDVRAQMLLVARQNEYNPIADYLMTCYEKWKVDRKGRIDTWLHDYCGAENNEFNRRVGGMWLIGAAARGLQPGSKMDNVLVLEGRQGVGKSTSLDKLAGAWFSDSPLVIGNKDSMQMTSYCWIIELAELASLRQSETESQKQFLSARKDKYRPPYGSAPEDFLRFAVFGGTTNDEEYLPDRENRRYWPVAVGKCNTLQLLQDRDLIWGEAVFRYLHAELNPHLAHDECPGERWWFATEEEQDMASKVVAKRRPENVWASLVREWMGTKLIAGPGMKRQWTLAEIAQGALQIDAEKLGAKQKQISAAVREAGLVSVKGEGGRPMWRAPDELIERMTGEKADQDARLGPN